MAAQTIRYGLIGSGMMGHEHLRNLKVIPGSSVVAIADPHEPSRTSAAALAGEGARLFEDTRSLVEADLCDAIVIAAPNDTHTQILQTLFTTGRHVPILVEKPICTEQSDLTLLRDAAAAYGAPVWVGMEYRYMPPLAMMAEEVFAGVLGTPKMLSIREHRHSFLPKVGDWNRFARRTGGTLVEKCCHFFDLMRYLTRSEPTRIYASGAADFNHLDERYDGRTPDILDNAFVVVDFQNGMRAHLDLCMFADGSWWQEDICMVGDKAKIECLIPASRGYAQEVHAEVVVSPRAQNKAPEHRTVTVDEDALAAGSHHGSTYYEHLGFRKVVLGEGEVDVTVEDGLLAVAMGMAAELSVKERRVVEISGLTLR